MNMQNKSSIFENRPYYKPFNYPKYYEYWKTQEMMVWTPFEVDMSGDLHDFNTKITEDERIFLTHLLRFFTQTDIEVSKGYIRLLNMIKQTEIQMMLISFLHIESVHIVGYEHLVHGLGLPESSFKTFLEYEDIRAKYEYLQEFDTSSKYATLCSIGIFNGFVEGFILFSSFCMLLSFSRFGLFTGLGQIISWSARDEFLHASAMADLFNDIRHELSSEIDNEKLQAELNSAADILLEMELTFIRSSFTHNGRKLKIRGISESEVIDYVKFLVDLRLRRLGLPGKPEYAASKENIPEWIFEIMGLQEQINFFTNRGTSYTKSDSWEGVG